jgi:hypothetical protein
MLAVIYIILILCKIKNAMKKQFLFVAIMFFIFISFTKAQTYSVGDIVEVKWKGCWYQASILDTNSSNLYKVHYCGLESSDDEWVGTIRLRNGYYKTGDNVQVLWKGKYYAAKILSVNGFNYKVHYSGYDSKWDEWIQCIRIKKSS